MGNIVQAGVAGDFFLLGTALYFVEACVLHVEQVQHRHR